MRYRVRYNISAARVVDNTNKRTTSTKASGRVVDLPNVSEASGNQKVHKAILNVLMATHAKHEHMDEEHIAIELVSVIRLITPKRPDFVKDVWTAEPVEKSTEAMAADPDAMLPHSDKDGAPTGDEEDNWDDMDEDVVPPNLGPAVKQTKLTAPKKKLAKKPAKK